MFGFFAFSQDFQISPFAGYQLSGKLKLDDRDVEFDNGVNFGIRFSRGFQGKNIELSYSHFLTEASLHYLGNETEREKASMGYIEVALVQDIQTGNSKVLPYFMVSTGSSFEKVNTISGSTWSFVMGVGGGISGSCFDAAK